MAEPGAPLPASFADPPRSPWRIFAERLLHNRAALTGGVLLAILYLAAIFGSFIAPYHPNKRFIGSSDHPPSDIRFVDAEGEFHWRPFVYRTRMTDMLRRTYETDTSERYPLQFFVRADSYKLWWLFETDRHLFGVGPAADGVETADGERPRVHLLGTDKLGRDLFARILAGAKVSLSIGLIGIMITMSLGMVVGGAAGYIGGWVDTVLMRFVELIMSIPALYLILALRAALSETNPMLELIFGVGEGERLTSVHIYIMMVVILGLVSWGSAARVIRGMVLAIRKLDYVSAARALGASPAALIARHLLPNTLTYVIIASTLSIPSYILGEVALSFLGVGIEQPQASWGNMLADAQNVRSLADFPWLLAPGFFIFVTVFAFNFLGDGVRDALDPKHIK